MKKILQRVFNKYLKLVVAFVSFLVLLTFVMILNKKHVNNLNEIKNDKPFGALLTTFISSRFSSLNTLSSNSGTHEFNLMVKIL